MKGKCLIIILILLFGNTFAGRAQQSDYFPHRLIIKYKAEAQLQEIRAKTASDPKMAVQKLLKRRGAQTSRPLLSDRASQYVRNLGLPSAGDVLRIREITFGGKIDVIQLAAKIGAMPGVAYAEPKYIRKMHLTPNDPKLEKYINTHNFTDAWDLSSGSENLLIAIVDGGVGYTHPELNDHLWVNQEEVPPTLEPQADQNGDGKVTATEVRTYIEEHEGDNNGDGTIDLQDALSGSSSFMDNLDTDNNNFTDDLFGWDFWASGSSSGQITSDNNPFHDETDHGTHVAGIAAAETNNNQGIAGAAFTTTYMAVKAGGATGNSNSIGFGFNGMIYAAQQGADVINCSWGSSGSSQAEQDVIDLVTEMGSLVVASAGNESANQISYPAGYDRVLSVGSVSSNGSASSYTNYGYSLDVLATGNDIQSTSFDEKYTSKSGTSMSTPVVSGLAALVRDLHPGWTAERIGMQIRASASYIYSNNGSKYDHKLGHGSIRAFKALNTDLPGLKVVSHSFVNRDGQKLIPGQPGTLQLTLTNLGSTTSNLQIDLNSLNEQGIALENSTRQLGSIATGDTLSTSFSITISEEFDLSQTPTLRVNFKDDNYGYTDFGIVRYQSLLYDVLAANNVKTSLAADGTIGFTNPLSQSGGVGFIPRTPDGSGGYNAGDNLLFEGGLMIETGGVLFDAVRSTDGVSRDFAPLEVFLSKAVENGEGAMGSARFRSKTDSIPAYNIDLRAYAFDNPDLSNVVFVKYTIKNPSSFAVMEDVYVGLFNDWDIGNAGNNSTSYSEADSILYLSDSTVGSTQPKVAVAHLGPISSALAIDNTIEGRRDSLFFGLYDGFTDTEKKIALKAGTERTDIENTDVSAVISSGPYTINPGAQISVGFVYAFGNTTAGLRNRIATARAEAPFQVSSTGVAVADKVPNQTRLYQNYPNPFSKRTRLRLDIRKTTNISLVIYDVLGRKVRTLLNRQLKAGKHFIPLRAGNLSSGVYFVRLKTEKTTQTIPITHIK